MDMTQIDKKQIHGIVKERNLYRCLLDECLFALNALPMHNIADGNGGNTYKLAAKIEQAFRSNTV
jgi:hypothetical protein